MAHTIGCAFRNDMHPAITDLLHLWHKTYSARAASTEEASSKHRYVRDAREVSGGELL